MTSHGILRVDETRASGRFDAPSNLLAVFPARADERKGTLMPGHILQPESAVLNRHAYGGGASGKTAGVEADREW